jgi:hypothetical protein
MLGTQQHIISEHRSSLPQAKVVNVPTTTVPATTMQFGAEGHVCSCGGHCPTCLQTKLQIGKSDDQYEREADQIAERVVNRQPAQGIASDISPGIQRKTSPRSLTARQTDQQVVTGLLPRQGEAISPTLTQELSSRMGHDFSHVRVHHDPESAIVARSLGARAFTVGNHIAFAPGEYAPDTKEGKRLLVHELAHVVQQGPKPMLQRKIYTRPGLTIDNYLINKGVNFRKIALHYRGVTVDRKNLDKEILTTMLLSPRNFFIAGTTQQSVIKNLDEHVDTRKRVIGFAASKKYRFGVGSQTKVNTQHFRPTSHGYDLRKNIKPMKAFKELIANSAYAISCGMATKVTMLAGTNYTAYAEDPSTNKYDWIPGDWGYIQNSTFTPLFNDEGEEGENIIYVGNYSYWGHISNKQTYKTLPQWTNLVAKWGVPVLFTWRRRPTNGLI